MRIEKQCGCGARIVVESVGATSANNTITRDAVFHEREDAKKQIASWDREHKGHGDLPAPVPQSPLTIYPQPSHGTGTPLPPRPEITC